MEGTPSLAHLLDTAPAPTPLRPLQHHHRQQQPHHSGWLWVVSQQSWSFTETLLWSRVPNAGFSLRSPQSQALNDSFINVFKCSLCPFGARSDAEETWINNVGFLPSRDSQRCGSRKERGTEPNQLQAPCFPHHSSQWESLSQLRDQDHEDKGGHSAGSRELSSEPRAWAPRAPLGPRAALPLVCVIPMGQTLPFQDSGLPPLDGSHWTAFLVLNSGLTLESHQELLKPAEDQTPDKLRTLDVGRTAHQGLRYSQG